MNNETEGITSFEQVLSAELAEIERSRQARITEQSVPGDRTNDVTNDVTTAGTHDTYKRAHDMKLTGLAFSGGGIRSATFNLGILQGLARLHLLRKVDYLSTVSGGGYIGSWLSACIKRVGSMGKVEEELRKPGVSGAEYREPDAITFLRKYSNYLTPRMGLLTADTWALIAVYLRNLALNLTIISSFFLALFLVPRLTVWYAKIVTDTQSNPLDFLFDRALLYLTFSVFFISLSQSYWSIKKRVNSPAVNYPWYAQPGGVLTLAVLPILMSAQICGLWLWTAANQGQLAWHHVRVLLVYVVVSWGIGSFIAWINAYTSFSKKTSLTGRISDGFRGTYEMVHNHVREGIRPASLTRTGFFLLWLMLSLAVGCGLFYCLFLLFRSWPTSDQSSLWYAVNFGLPLVLVVFMTMGTTLIGLAGSQMPDESREWWSRLGGWLLICALIWTLLCAIAFFSLPVIAAATGIITSGWIASTIAGVVLGKSPATGGGKSKKMTKIAAAVLPSLFVAGLLMFLSFITSSVLILTNQEWAPELWKMIWLDNMPLAGLMDTNFYIMNYSLDHRLVTMFAVSLGAAVFLSWRMDINQFSIHLLYRNRLVRGYLGASNENRQGQPFTGFDPNDDLLLSDLKQNGTSTSTAYHGPYHIINTALNLVKGRDLAWQTRKASAFMLTPLYSGYISPSLRKPEKQEYRYQPTAEYGKPDGMSLGTAMAISGAAASPNMGYHSSPALAFLMTVFNVRLGWWSGNPLYPKKWEKAGPGLGLWYMLKELFGLTNDETAFVYLSDGGHFENLGIYELVKRRCRFIIACDAGQDENMKFDDMGNALRKIRVDLGVDITIDVSPIRDGKKHCALGKIIYKTHDGKEENGDLIYIKTSLCTREPADVLNYQAQHMEFPHQTTADQWFDEAQFESYRMLGLHTVQEICERWEGGEMEAIVRKVETYIEQQGKP